MANIKKEIKEETSTQYYKAPLKFFNNLHRVTVLVVGAGGTGSLVMTRLARIHLVLVDMGYKGLNVTLIDYDTVEPHNIGRQMFTNYDIGRNKAEVMIEKINTSFLLDWKHYKISYKDYLELTGWNSNKNIIISCVDNVDCRKNIKRNFYIKSNNRDQRYKNHLWFDCGNGKDFGQVIMSDRKHKLPNVFDLFPDIEKQAQDKEIQGDGCSIWEGLNTQDLFVNDDVSVMLANMLWTLLRDKKIDYHAAYSNLETMQRSKSFIKNIVN